MGYRIQLSGHLYFTLKKATSGDTIIIKEGYSTPEPSTKYTIDQNLSIIGQGNEDNKPKIYDQIFIKNSTVILKNLDITCQIQKKNIINVSENGSLIGSDIGLYNKIRGETYPSIYVDESSSIKLSRSYVSDAKYANNPTHGYVWIDGGKIEASESIFETKIYSEKKSELKLEKSTIECSITNALSIVNDSIAIIENSEISGGNTEKNLPCVYIDTSNVSLKETNIVQNKDTGAVYLKNDSYVTFNDCMVSSITSNNSTIKVNTSLRIIESFFIFDRSTVFGDVILIDGLENGKINLFATKKSKISSAWIGFGQKTNPTVKVADLVSLDSPLYMLEYDSREIKYVFDENNDFLIIEDFSGKESVFKENEESPKKNPTKKLSAFDELDKMIGLQKVKNQVKEFVAVSVVNKKREEKGLKSSLQTLHSVFAGNPGTGKTTVARLLGKLLYEKGVIKKNILVETSRADLVASYIGQTAPKTRKVLESALGGILFIDEAYTLTPDTNNDFGQEAIDEILKFMEDHRSEIMIIFAGYSNEMEKFLQSNPGLKSRVPNTFYFEDYSNEEMVEIGMSTFKANKYKVNEKLYREVLLNNLSLSNDNSNGRWVRNFNEAIQKSSL